MIWEENKKLDGERVIDIDILYYQSKLLIKKFKIPHKLMREILL